MGGTQAGGNAPPLADRSARTPIWISHRLQIALIAAGILLLAFAIWLVPDILTIVIGAMALALILSFPVR
jgi:hypothetical protein